MQVFSNSVCDCVSKYYIIMYVGDWILNWNICSIICIGCTGLGSGPSLFIYLYAYCVCIYMFVYVYV